MKTEVGDKETRGSQKGEHRRRKRGSERGRVSFIRQRKAGGSRSS